MSDTVNPADQASVWFSAIDGFDPKKYLNRTACTDVKDVRIYDSMVKHTDNVGGRNSWSPVAKFSTKRPKVSNCWHLPQ